MDPQSLAKLHSFLSKAAYLMKKAKDGEEQRARQAGREPLKQQAFSLMFSAEDSGHLGQEANHKVPIWVQT